MKTSQVLTLISIYALTGIAFTANAQSSFTLRAGTSIPILDFGSDDYYDDDAAGAATGLNFGMEYMYTYSESNLGIFGSIDLNINGLQKTVKDALKEEVQAIAGQALVDHKFPKYVNIPVSCGANYGIDITENIAFEVNGGLVLNFLVMTDYEVTIANVKIVQKADLAESIGFKIGAGFLFKDKFPVTINYYGLGTHKIQMEVSAAGASETQEVKGKVDMLTATLGVRF